MNKILFAWIGMADLAATGADTDDYGPIAQAVLSEEYEHLFLLNDHGKKAGNKYVEWLRTKCANKTSLIPAKLTSPTHFSDIYEHVTKTLTQAREDFGAEREFVFHLSPGTPAMAAVWIIVSKTRFPATLLESSKAHGVRIASVPFDISADYLPDLMQRPDNQLIKLSGGLPPEAPEFESIVHRCIAMRRLIVKARHVAPRNIPVLLMGESGTGKELMARAIHKASLQSSGPFVAVNCGAIPHDLVESELFGHEKGAFTGATAARTGYIATASDGVLFLDEVGELPLSIQVKLLRVLQEKMIIRLGGTKPMPVNFRLITATNRNLLQEVVENRFREDLFHRIAVAVLHIPPLRERQGDISLLVDRLLSNINKEAVTQPGYKNKKLSPSARNLLASHSWPGNVRELHNVLQRAAVWSMGETISKEDIREAILPMPGKMGQDMLGRAIGEGFNLQALMTELARHYLQRALEEAHGNKTKAASLLGLPSYQTFTNWMQRYDVNYE